MPLPTTHIGKLVISRLVMGGNPVSGFSHAGAKRDKAMLDYFTAANAKALLRRCEAGGINTVQMRADRHIMRLLHEYWSEGGKLQWIAQTAPECDWAKNIGQIREFGASAAYLHGGVLDDAFARGDYDSQRRIFDRIREAGLPVGVAAHDPDNLRKVRDLGWKPDFYMVCLYNIPGYKGQLSAGEDEKFVHGDRAKALPLFRELEAPGIAYKVCAAGRFNPRESFAELGRFLKPTDIVNVGMYPPDNPNIVEDNVALANEFLPR